MNKIQIRVLISLFLIFTVIIFEYSKSILLKEIYLNADNIQKNIESNIQNGVNAVRFINLAAQEILKNKNKLTLHYSLLAKEINDMGDYTLGDVYDKNTAFELKANIAGYGGLKKDIETLQEMEMSLLLTPYFKEIKTQNKDYSWIYYYSDKNFLTLYPFVESESFTLNAELKKKPLFQYATPEKNPQKAVFFTPVYIDTVGMGLMVTIGLPVYNNEVFLGVTEIDITLSSMASILKKLDRLDNRSIIINKELSILGEHNFTPLSKTQITHVNKFLPPSIINAGDVKRSLKLIDGEYVYIKTFSNAPWKFIYLKNANVILLQSFLHTLPGFLLMIVIIFINYLYLNSQKLNKKLGTQKKQLEQKQDELNKYQINLEHTVIERTQELKQQHERLKITLQSIGDGVITTYADGRVEYLNPIAEKLTGWPTIEAEGKLLSEIFPISNEITGEAITSPVESVLENNIIIGLANHTLLTLRDGSQLSIEDSAAPIHNELGEITGVVLVFHDSTEERLLKEKMSHQATHDTLTGIWNRSAFENKLTDLQFDSSNSNAIHALLYLDLDQFKVVNDTAGHIAGDELLKQISVEFNQIIRNSDMLARIGGDEFSVLLQNCDEKHALQVAESLRSMLERYIFIWDTHSYPIRVSIGIAMITPSSQISDVMSQADVACYKAKNDGRNCIHLYSGSDKELSAQFGEMHWVSKIQEAFEQNNFILYSQKIAAINADDSDYREVLVRMKNESGGIIPPNAFIPAAERYGLMSKIDKLVIDTALTWLIKQPAGSVKLSINLSGQSLGDKEFLKQIEQKLKQIPEFSQYIIFEITETAAIANLRVAIQFMQRLRNHGVKFSLDDFGSGLSSFSYLKNMPVSYIKIDGIFVRDMVNDTVDAAMVHAINQVGQKTGLETIAEFVENQETFEQLKEYGVNYAQGFYIEKPKPLLPE